ncbi:polyunsaturated fatty acid lipoxygenase ALOX8-like [Lampris incognitus]|uniref:polyunsaturated fatty acid lipoxygenase ALOX8-like n=1 Tax=Lampris incognitus TaxID=2546036 RepID=UPI0024B612F9|nr:polyunsaturated fatty acid lipoxygenase ALOX8-like [Lampris incognitus]
MAQYKLQVTTGSVPHAGSINSLYVTLIGTGGQSERTQLTSAGLNFQVGQTRSYTVTTLFSLGCLLLLKLEKGPYREIHDDEWLCSKIVVRTPDDDAILFPCHRWVAGGEHVVLRGGRATKDFEDDHPLLIEQRKKELVLKKQTYRWDLYAEGVPFCINIKDPLALPAEFRFSLAKSLEFDSTNLAGSVELWLKGLTHPTGQWDELEDIKKIFWFRRMPISEYVSKHWKEDELFGYQLLNGVNPNVIQRCPEMPSNFPVTDEMVKPFLANGTSLAVEMKMGNIFICDYKIMEGLPTKVIDGKPVPLTAALTLLYLNREKKLMPIAIQLSQQPTNNTPIFLPSDSEMDWLLAKLFVRNADVLHHQFVSYFLKTHLLSEVFAVATLRNLPTVHPLYKLLIPHHRHTLHINILSRARLFGPGRLLENSSLEITGSIELWRRSLSETTYGSLCLPENIVARGLESVPNFYYRDDGLRLWSIINSFVTAVVSYYYPSNGEVTRDSELQEWISEIFTYGFLENTSLGIPESFETVEEVIKFVTMVIYTSSAQHGAFGGGQFDYLSWIPNGPFLLRRAPPAMKGQSSKDSVLETLQDVAAGSHFLSALWLLSKQYNDFVPLGTYYDDHFDEAAPKQMIKDFQRELSSLSVAIAKRNSQLHLPYNYLNPAKVQNSATV